MTWILWNFVAAQTRHGSSPSALAWWVGYAGVELDPYENSRLDRWIATWYDCRMYGFQVTPDVPR